MGGWGAMGVYEYRVRICEDNGWCKKSETPVLGT